MLVAAGTGPAEGQVVFVGSGISSPAQKHDDYAGLDVKGKIVLIVPGTPTGIDASKLAENESGQGAAQGPRSSGHPAIAAATHTGTHEGQGISGAGRRT